MIIVLISLDSRVVLNNIFGVNYNFVVRFPIGHVYNEVEGKQLLLNSLSFTSLGSLFHQKKETVFDRHELTIFFKRKCVSSN